MPITIKHVTGLVLSVETDPRDKSDGDKPWKVSLIKDEKPLEVKKEIGEVEVENLCREAEQLSFACFGQ